MDSLAINRRVIFQEDLEHVTNHIAPVMGAWKGAQILVTGATGFFGQWLLETFHHVNQHHNLGAQLVGVASPTDDLSTNSSHVNRATDIKLIKCDIRDIQTIIDLMPPEWSGRVDCIIHAAIYVNSKTMHTEPLPTLSTCFKGTWETLELAKRVSAKRFLYISSGAVYGPQPRTIDRIRENHGSSVDCADPSSAYAEGKRVAETVCCAYMRQHGVPVVIARPFAFVGPHLPLDKHFAIGNFIRDALSNRPITIHSDGSPVRSYMYAADLAIWLWTILTKGIPGRPYNVGSEHAYSLREVASLIARPCSSMPAIEVLGPPESGLPSRYVPDTTRAKEELGLRTLIQLEDAIERTLSWYHL